MLYWRKDGTFFQVEPSKHRRLRGYKWLFVILEILGANELG